MQFDWLSLEEEDIKQGMLEAGVYWELLKCEEQVCHDPDVACDKASCSSPGCISPSFVKTRCRRPMWLHPVLPEGAHVAITMRCAPADIPVMQEDAVNMLGKPQSPEEPFTGHIARVMLYSKFDVLFINMQFAPKHMCLLRSCGLRAVSYSCIRLATCRLHTAASLAQDTNK